MRRTLAPFLALFLVFAARAADAATATARRGMVASEHEIASRAGAEMLEAGGNAVDAAVATAFATGVVNPTSSGIGGGGFLILSDAGDGGRLHVLDFRETAPAAAHRDLFVRSGEVDPQLSLRGGLAVGVPGEVAGLAAAIGRFGTLPLARALAPAIRAAEQGFPVGRHLAEMIARHAAEIAARPELRKVFLRPDGKPWNAGERIRRPDLAATLRRIAADGPAAFYEGELAGRIAAAVRTAGGILTREDLAAYRIREREPVTARYRGHTIAAVPPPSSGGGVILEILNVLSGFDPSARPRRDVRNLHRLAEASKLAFADRARFYGDPGFVEVPLARLLSAEHATKLRNRILPDRAIAPGPGEPLAADHGTSHLSVVDAAGNAVALTTTVNTAFGSMVVPPGTGILLNNQMDDFSAAPGEPNVYGLVGTEANSVRAGKRPLSSMSPTLVLRGSAPVLSVGASGGPFIISATLQTILNVLDHGMTLDAAVAEPRIHHQWLPNLLLFEPALDATVRNGLRSLGHELREVTTIASVQAVQVTPDGIVGVADDRKGGFPVGW